MRHCCTPSHRSSRVANIAHGKGNLARVEEASQRAVLYAEAEQGNAPLVQMLDRA